MAQIPILNGITTDSNSDFRTSYPRNLVPVPKKTGISNGYLRPSDGLEQFGQGPGVDRGGINWDGRYYRVMGSKFIEIDEFGNHTVIGDVGNNGKEITFDYSFDYLGVSSNENFFLYDKATLQQVTDPDLGRVIDFVWIDGYFMTTDGEFLVVTDLNDPFSVSPFKFGSSEVNPDPVNALLKLNNEVYALNRYTIEVFDNVGGTGFPFRRIERAQINRGVIGTHACCVFLQTVAFVGNKLNESPAVWLGLNGQTTKISTREIDQILKNYTEAELSKIRCEARVYDNHEQLYIHLPDQTLVYDGPASQSVREPVWFILTTSIEGLGQYKAKNFVYVFDDWYAGDPTSYRHSKITNEVSSHFGELNGWDFETLVVYNNGYGMIFHEIELVSLTGRSKFGDESTIFTSYSSDGVTFSMERGVSAGKQGERNKRLSWLQQGVTQKYEWRIQRFRGTSDAHLSVARLETRVESLNV